MSKALTRPLCLIDKHVDSISDGFSFVTNLHSTSGPLVLMGHGGPIESESEPAEPVCVRRVRQTRNPSLHRRQIRVGRAWASLTDRLP